MLRLIRELSFFLQILSLHTPDYNVVLCRILIEKIFRMIVSKLNDIEQYNTNSRQKVPSKHTITYSVKIILSCKNL